MNRYRWSDDDHHFGPFLYASDKYNNLSFVLCSGYDEHPGCRLRMSALGHTLIISLPPIIRPYREKIMAQTWDAATVERMGRDWYWHYDEREYGLSYGKQGGVGSGGFFQVFLGRQTHDSSTTQSWSCFTPWNNWRHVRRSMYDLDGDHYWTEPKGVRPVLTGATVMQQGMTWEQKKKIEDACPSRTFRFADFDGEIIECQTRIEEREWRLGTGWFKWLSRFCKPMVHRSLDLDFSKETGRRKGSWKGGTTGHAIDMLPGEMHESAFRRYCEGEDSRGGKKRDMQFIGEVSK